MVEKLSGQIDVVEVSSRRGRSATIVIGTVTDALPDVATTVTNSGTSGEMILDFVIRRGDSVELRISEGYLQWKTTTAVSWNNILLIADITPTIQVGTVTTGVAGTDVAVTNSGTGKDGVFNFTIPMGDSVELRIDGGKLQWKNTTAEAWTDILTISSITATVELGTVSTGAAGTEAQVTNSGLGKDAVFNFIIPRGDDVSLRIDSGYLQWKNTTALTWTNIIAVSDITATIDIGTVVTGDADTSVTFTNSGSGKDAVFNVSIPKGTTFTPAVSAEGVISWTNDGGLGNPTSVNIKGIQGNPAPNTIWQFSADEINWSTTPPENVIYMRESSDDGVTWSDAILMPTVAALALKAPLSSPTFTGDVIVPDQTAGSNSTKAANTKYVDAKVAEAIANGVTGIAPSQDVVYDALALKADMVSLETEKKLLMDEIYSLKKSAIENSNAPYLTVSDYGDVMLAKNSVGVGTVGADGVTVTNLAVNGDLATGTTYNWAPGNAYSGISVVDGALQVECLSVNNAVGTANNMTLLAGSKYFVCFDFKPFRSHYPVVYTGATVTLSTLATQGVFTHVTGIFTPPSQRSSLPIYANGAVSTDMAIGSKSHVKRLMVINLTVAGLADKTASQIDMLVQSGYFDGKKTFSGTGCLVSMDSALAETGRMYFKTDPMYSNATLKDILTYSEGKYYHTHNVDSDGVAIAEPYDTEVDTNGQFLALSEGTVTYEPWYPDIGIYTDKFALDKAITAVKELYKYGSETPITDAVIAGNGLSFTSASLAAGDLAYGVFEFTEPLRPLMTIKSRNDDATTADTATGIVYTFRPVITNGVIASWSLTEV